MPGLRTEFDFTLPKGFISSDGVLHRNGVMRLATARDEIEPLRDRSIDGPDDPYLTILVLARVITQLGSLPEIGVSEVEGLFAADLAFLQEQYGIINFGDHDDVEALQASVLPAETATDDIPDGRTDVIEAEVIEADATAAGDIGGTTIGDSGDTASAPDEVRRAPTNRRRSRIEEVAPAAAQ
jgi:hypothetical protein